MNLDGNLEILLEENGGEDGARSFDYAPFERAQRTLALLDEKLRSAGTARLGTLLRPRFLRENLHLAVLSDRDGSTRLCLNETLPGATVHYRLSSLRDVHPVAHAILLRAAYLLLENALFITLASFGTDEAIERGECLLGRTADKISRSMDFESATLPLEGLGPVEADRATLRELRDVLRLTAQPEGSGWVGLDTMKFGEQVLIPSDGGDRVRVLLALRDGQVEATRDGDVLAHATADRALALLEEMPL